LRWTDIVFLLLTRLSIQLFYLIDWSRFLVPSYGATEKVVEEIKKEEEILNVQVAKEEDNQKTWMRQLRKILEHIDRELIIYSEDTIRTFNVRNSLLKVRLHYEDFLFLYDSMPSPTGIEVIDELMPKLRRDINDFLRMYMPMAPGSTAASEIINALISAASELRKLIRHLLIGLEYQKASK
jgi:hypothetical protein